jgi:two-component system sensor histidine kinase KdpD
VAAMGAATTLMEMGSHLDKNKMKTLVNQIYLELEQHNRLINNLLQITYLEADSIKLKKQFFSLNNIIHAVIDFEKSKLGNRQINIQIPADLPLIPLDDTLIKEVLINLIENAIQFTPLDTPIDISAFAEKDKVVVSIEDRGPGIVPDEVNRLFEKFYRGRMLTSKRGLGLGLAICKYIVNAHAGIIWAENRKDSGAAFRFTLPL